MISLDHTAVTLDAMVTIMVTSHMMYGKMKKILEG